MASVSPAPRAASPVLADLLPGERVRDVLLVGGFALAIALGAQLSIMLPGGVPLTAQTFVVLLGAAALGPTRAASGAAVFLLVGLAGVPWFAASSGRTLGYIAGFVVASWVVGRCARAGWLTSYWRTAVAMVLGNLIIWSLGVPVLALVAGIGLPAALAAGVVPFLIGDAIKVALAVALLPSTQRLLNR